MHPSLCIQCTASAKNEGQRRCNEGQKRKAPTRKNPHERLTVKRHTLECDTKISQYPIYGNGFDKTSVYKAKIPHFAYKAPRVARRASTKQGIFYAAKTAKSKIKSGTAHRQCRSLQRPQPFKYPPCCASSRGRADLLMLLYHNPCKKKSGRPESLPLQCVFVKKRTQLKL